MLTKEDGDYLRGAFRRLSGAVRGTIVSKKADGGYVVQREDTLANVIAQRGDVSGEFSIGQFVTLSIPDRSGATAGTGYTIIARQTTNSRSTSLASRFSNQVNNPAEAIARITVGGVTVRKVQLTHGGAAVTILIYGSGLATAAVYGVAGITDNVAQVITSSLITIQPIASGGTALGKYSLTVAGQVLANFFEVV